MRLSRLASLVLCLCLLTSALFVLRPAPASADSGVCAIPGRDGPGGTLSGVVNTYYPGSASVAAGSTSIPVGSPSGAATPIAAGDLLLVMQMQDAEIDSTNTGAYGDGTAGDPATGSTNLNNAGRYEYVVATGPVAAGSVPITGAGAGGGLVYAYTDANATATQGQRRFQVIRVPQYSTATLSSALTALAWDGQVGGVLALDVAGQLTLGGTVSVSGLGFRGGGGRQLGGAVGLANTDYRTLATVDANGAKGEGIAGTPRHVYDGTSVVDTGVEGYPNGSMARGAPGHAGGGGTDGNPAANDENSGGGGGGNGGAGGLGGFTWSSVLSRGGFGGAAFSAAAPDRFVMGGGGGAGTRNNTPGIAAASSGGVGGGIVIVRAGTLSGTGTIVADGGTGVVPDNDGGGGGGAGGTILLTAETWAPTSLTVSAVGGAGANTWPTQPPGTPGEFTTGSANNRHGPGGGGGGGVILLSSAVNTVTGVSGGSNGTSTTALSPFGAQPGAAGIVSTTVTASQITTGICGVLCLPIITTTKTTSTPSVVNGPGGTSATYTITVANAVARGTALSLSISDALPAGFTYAWTGSVVLSGGAARSPVTNPSAGDTNPAWGVFTLPGGGQVEITFTVDIASSVPDGTYQNPAMATYLDPQRSTVDGTTSSSYNPASSSAEDVTVTSATPTPTNTSTNTPTSTETPTRTATSTETPTGTATYTPTATETPTSTATDTPTSTTTNTPTATETSTSTATSTNTPTSTATSTETPTATETPTSTATDTPTSTTTNTPTATETSTSTPTSTETSTSTATSTPTSTGTPTASETPTPTATSTATGVPTVIDPAVAKSGDPATASVGEAVTFTVVVTNNGNADADNVELSDVLPAFLDITGVVVSPPGPAVTIAGSTVTVDFGTLAPSDVYTVTITTVVNSLATPPGGINIATLMTTSPDADPDNNQASATLAIVVPGVPEAPGTGFAPGRLTVLPPVPSDRPYLSYGDLWLEIPALGVEIPIVGIPRSAAGWDVTWLWDQAGYLNGTAFPTWTGNSVITAHVSLPSGREGPFAGLQRLRYGQAVIIHGWGLRYLYEIREVDLVASDDPSVFRHEERPWLTLLTCHGYDEQLATYRLRVAAHAVLVAIEQEDEPSAWLPANSSQQAGSGQPKVQRGPLPR